MRRAQSLNVMQQQLRARICPNCIWRPEGSESLAPEIPRFCQGECPVFQNLPELMQTAQQMDSMLGSYQQTMRHRVSRVCKRIAASGHQSAGQAGPLGRYRVKVIEVLHALRRG